MTKSLLDELTEYGNGDVYPFHMPGHKRHPIGDLSGAISKIDITEIDGFDNMHYPEGILLEAQRRAAHLYGAEHTFFLVNGSTVGNLASIAGTVRKGGKLLIARNCHKSVYHGAYLREIDLHFIEPVLNQPFGFCEPVTAQQVEEVLQQEKGIEAVLVVSPTYEGRIAEIEEIAKVVHSFQIPLIVDEAHGAHLGMNVHFAQNSIQAGADVVIHSLHKTLPSLTQTALLHVQGDLVSAQQIQKYLRIYQSSSPSYLFMASMDECVRLMEEKGTALLENFYIRWCKMLQNISNCQYLQFPIGNHQDIGKLVIAGKHASISGVELYNKLLHSYGLQMEMACDTYVLAMFTVGDTEEAFERMEKALLSIDDELARNVQEQSGDSLRSNHWLQQPGNISEKNPLENSNATKADCMTELKFADEVASIPFWEAYDLPSEEKDLEQAEGCLAAEFVSVYPPGVPILIPGEVITRTIVEKIDYCIGRGLNVQGIRQEQGVKQIAVVVSTRV